MSHPAPRAEFSARYFVESSVPLEKVAQVIAGEQSSGTFLSLPGETDELKERSRARVVRIDPLPPALEPAPHRAVRRCAGRLPTSVQRKAMVTIRPSDTPRFAFAGLRFALFGSPVSAKRAAVLRDCKKPHLAEMQIGTQKRSDRW